MNIEELIDKIEKGRYSSAEPFTREILYTLLTTYTCEVAKIDEDVFIDADKIAYEGYIQAGNLSKPQKAHLAEYNRLITEKYQAKTETPEPELRVGWEYQNKQGEWVEIIRKDDGDEQYPFDSRNEQCFTNKGRRFMGFASKSDLILSTGRPVQKQPSPNWWESLKEGDFVKHGNGRIYEVENWYQEALGIKNVYIDTKSSGALNVVNFTPYTPTPTEAIADLKNGKITEEQFQKVYKG